MSRTKKEKKKKKRKIFFQYPVPVKTAPKLLQLLSHTVNVSGEKRMNSLASQTFANKCRQILQKEPHLICSPKITKRHYNIFIENRYFILRLAQHVYLGTKVHFW